MSKARKNHLAAEVSNTLGFVSPKVHNVQFIQRTSCMTSNFKVHFGTGI